MERRRRIATYVIVFRPLCAGAKLAVGRFEWWRAGRRLEALETKCTAQFLPQPPPGFKLDKPAMPPKGTVPIPTGATIAPLTLTDADFVCDGEELHRLVGEHPLSGIGNEIEQAFSRRQQNWGNTWQGALLL